MSDELCVVTLLDMTNFRTSARTFVDLTYL